MKIGKLIIHPWNKKNFIPRLIVLVLVLGWVIWGITIYQEGKRIEARKQALVQQYELRQARQRRQAAYKSRMLEEQAVRQGVQNAIDGVKK